MTKRTRRSILPELTHEELTYYLPEIEHILKQLTFKNPMTSKEICNRLNIKNGRFMKIINKLRRDGTMPICSGGRGYWLATTAEELFDVADSLADRQKVIKAAEEGLRQMAQDMQTAIAFEQIAKLNGHTFNAKYTI